MGPDPPGAAPAQRSSRISSGSTDDAIGISEAFNRKHALHLPECAEHLSLEVRGRPSAIKQTYADPT